MARQEGLLKFSGKQGDTVGYQRGGKHFSKAKAREYELTEESKRSGKEFGRGSTVGAMVRKAFEPLILPAFKEQLPNRLSEKFRQVIRSGPLERKGERDVFDGNIVLLKGFQFNAYTPFERIISVSPRMEIKPGSLLLSMPRLVWDKDIQAPDNAQRAVFGLMAGFFNFRENTYETTLCSELKAVKGKPFNGGSISIPIPQATEQAVLLMMNVYFDNGAGSRFDNRKYQAATLLEATHIKNGQIVVFEQDVLPVAEKANARSFDVEWQTH